MESQPKPQPAESPARPVTKQPYEPPRLRVEGTIEKLTREIGLQGSDGLTGSRLA